MKQNLLKILLLASTVTMSLCACDNTSNSSNNEVSTPASESVVESVKPSSTPSVETPSTPSIEESVEPSSEPSVEPSIDPVEEECILDLTKNPVLNDPNIEIELSRYVFIEGEDAFPYVTRFDVYSPALGQFKSYLNKAFSVSMPDECNDGVNYITVTSGAKEAKVRIFYFKDAETAAAKMKVAEPEEGTIAFDEAKYIVNGKLQFEITELDGELYKEINKVAALQVAKHMKDVTFNTKAIEVWSASKLKNHSVYDDTKLTMDHYVETKVGDDGQTVSIDHYNCTFLPENTPNSPSGVMKPADIYNYEFIVDGSGRIVYIGAINYTSGTWAHADSTEEYWSCYKDYRENPVFAFADDYDAETNRDAYQKVMPENGTWIIGYNNQPSSTGSLDDLWQSVTGLGGTMHSAASSIKLTMDDPKVEEKLLNTRIGYTSGRNIFIYSTIDLYEQYAYYYSLALASGDAEKIALRDKIYNALVMQSNPALKNEEVLLSYYEGVTSSLLDAWKAMF